MVYNTQNCWAFGLCPLSSILETLCLLVSIIADVGQSRKKPAILNCFISTAFFIYHLAAVSYHHSYDLTFTFLTNTVHTKVSALLTRSQIIISSIEKIRSEISKVFYVSVFHESDREGFLLTDLPAV
jgi:hypothetical protein